MRVESEESKAVGLLRRTMLELDETRQRLEIAESHARDPIAIVGMSCRLPGGADSPEGLWRLLAEGGDSVGEFPEDRGWDLSSLRYPDGASFVYDATCFDAEFFSIAAEEAALMDPQQRLLLEASWNALEDAGVDPSSLRGSSTGVYVGVNAQHYASLLLGLVAENEEGHFSTGNANSMVSGRVAHELGLEGPAVSVDTACSSSLSALHLGCQALRAGECSLALVGGAMVLATPWMFVEFSRQRLFALSRDGRCKSFADSADGAGWSEGTGVVVLERLSDALERERRILGVIRGSAVNQDGVSNGLTAPNGLSQERVMQAALEASGLRPSDVDALEAHGMGTALGDPVEAEAAIAVYGRDRDPATPLRLGSIKSNIGHPMAAGGIAGLLKVILALRNELLPPTLHVDRPSRHVDWSRAPVSLLTEPVTWRRSERPRRAAIHGFGMSGTNVHVVVEEPPCAPRRVVDEGRVRDDPIAFPVSGANEHALKRQARSLADHLQRHPELRALDIGYSLATTRAPLRERACVVAATRAELAEGLERIAEGDRTTLGSDPADKLVASWCGGTDVDWRAAFAGTDARAIELPSYRFERRRHWIDLGA